MDCCHYDEGYDDGYEKGKAEVEDVGPDGVPGFLELAARLADGRLQFAEADLLRRAAEIITTEGYESMVRHTTERLARQAA